MGISASQILRSAALLRPDAVAVISFNAPDASPGAAPANESAGGQRRETSYHQLDRLAQSVGSCVVDRVGAGQVVALFMDSGVDFIAAWFGAVYAGAILVPIPPTSSASEVRGRLAHSRAVGIITDAAHRDLAAAASGPGCVVLCAEDALASPKNQGASFQWVERSGAEPIMILYTSGTTGHAKGAVITHSSLVTHGLAVAQSALRLTVNDRILGALPLTHSYGCRMVMIAGLLSGATIILPHSRPGRFSARESLQVMADEGVTWLPAVPTMYAAWARVAAAERPRASALRVKWALSAGAPLAEGVRRGAEAVLGCELRQGYGMTEATFCTINTPAQEQQLGSVGRPLWGVEVEVRDPGGQAVPAGRDGEVWVRGPNAMEGYLDAPELSAAMQDRGWLRSGDVGRRGQAGELYIVDRLKDIILRGGFTIYPAEVESVLSQHPAVAQVAVIGVPQEFYGEAIVAVVVLARDGGGGAATLDALAANAWVREGLAPHKAPTGLALVDTMPLGPSRKVLKRVLRDMAARSTLAIQSIGPRPDL